MRTNPLLVELAQAVGIPTHRRGANRPVQLTSTELRLAIANRCLGLTSGPVSIQRMEKAADVDNWLATAVVANFRGQLGWLHQQAQTALRKANEARAVASAAWEQARKARTPGRNRNVARRKAMDAIEQIQREWREWLEVVRVSLDMIELERDMTAAGYDLSDVERGSRADSLKALHAEMDRRRAAQVAILAR